MDVNRARRTIRKMKSKLDTELNEAIQNSKMCRSRHCSPKDHPSYQLQAAPTGTNSTKITKDLPTVSEEKSSSTTQNSRRKCPLQMCREDHPTGKHHDQTSRRLKSFLNKLRGISLQMYDQRKSPITCPKKKEKLSKIAVRCSMTLQQKMSFECKTKGTSLSL